MGHNPRLKIYSRTSKGNADGMNVVKFFGEINLEEFWVGTTSWTVSLTCTIFANQKMLQIRIAIGHDQMECPEDPELLKNL